MNKLQVIGLISTFALIIHNILIISTRAGKIIPFRYFSFDIVGVSIYLVILTYFKELNQRIKYSTRAFFFLAAWIPLTITWRFIGLHYLNSELLTSLNGGRQIEWDASALQDPSLTLMIIMFTLFGTAGVIYSIGFAYFFLSLKTIIKETLYPHFEKRTVVAYISLNSISSLMLAIGAILLILERKTSIPELIDQVAVPTDTSSFIIVFTSLAVGIKNGLVPYFALASLLIIAVYFTYLTQETIRTIKDQIGEEKAQNYEHALLSSRTQGEEHTSLVPYPTIDGRKAGMGRTSQRRVQMSMTKKEQNVPLSLPRATRNQSVICWNCYRQLNLKRGDPLICPGCGAELKEVIHS